MQRHFLTCVNPAAKADKRAELNRAIDSYLTTGQSITCRKLKPRRKFFIADYFNGNKQILIKRNGEINRC